MAARFVLSFLMTLLGLFAFSQTDTTAVDTSKVYTLVEQMPEYPGGDIELLKVFRKGFHYPKECEEFNYQTSKLKIKFIVERDGSTSNIEVAHIDCPYAKASILNTLQSLKFRPGKQNGITVRTQFSTATYIHFR